MYTLVYHKKTLSDKQNLKAANLLQKAYKLCVALAGDPYPINSEQLISNLKGRRSVRINLQHRLVYEVIEEEKLVKILRMWSHSN